MGTREEERSLRARIGGFAKSAKYDPKESTAPARAAFLDRFTKIVDPAGELDEAERQRRAEAALREHMARLALKSSKARRKQVSK